MKLKYILFLLSIAISPSLSAQASHHDHEEEGHHVHHKNEVGIANSAVYFINEAELTYGVHIHYTRKIGESKFGAGIGYERLFDEHKHNTIGIIALYRPVERWSIGISPGLTFEDGSPDLRFALHFETIYEFEVGDFHIGPEFDFAYDPEDFHLSIGLHVGLGF